jgi:LAO/AO transport system kinase
MDNDKVTNSILGGDLLALARAITLVESQRKDHRIEAMSLVSKLHNPQKETLRLGITGIPGVGKSTFIEQLGLHIANQGLKVAVLAIDPSSWKSAGSILGDKTRMEELSKHPNVFIRPSPSGGTLGGVAARTRESMILCEAAGFHVIIIETVGVGQSETEVINITDTFLMLAMPGTGDELQGIKRGIMETADLIVINKADGDNLQNAQKAKKQIEMALHLFPASDSGWTPKVLLASALLNEGIKICWETIQQRQRIVQENGWLDTNRILQQKRAFHKLNEVLIYDRISDQLGKNDSIHSMEEKIQNGEINEF